jgi:serine phosphatase RsbU (regulator of sigma subunit)
LPALPAAHGFSVDSDQPDPGTPVGFRDASGRPTTESMGEGLIGSILDRAHLMPPRLVGPLLAQELGGVGAGDVAVYLQDFEQVGLQPLTGPGLVGEPAPIDDTSVGQAFATDSPVEEQQDDGCVRLNVPMLDGSDRVGVLSFTLPRVNDADRRLAQRIAGLAADLIVTKAAYTDTFFQVRATTGMSLPAQLQRQLLPPLSMTTPDVDLSGILEPAYDVGGDSFDYALEDHVLHFAVLDAMGHGLEAATMATVAVGAYRHGRRTDASLPELYRGMDDALAQAFPGRFATAQLGQLDTATGELQWVNAGHHAALWLRGAEVIGELSGAPTRPVGFGGASPQVHAVGLEPGDRLLFFTDGVVEERVADGQQFGEARLRQMLEQATAEGLPAAETVRHLSHALMAARRGRTSDDASLLLVEWKNPPRDDELAPGIPEATPAGRGR